MLKGRGRDPRAATTIPPHLARPLAQAHHTAAAHPVQPAHSVQPAHPMHLQTRPPMSARAPLAKPEPDYEVVEFPSDQYVNAKLQPPPPPPPRPPTGHPAEATSCGLCGGGGARVRCTECGRRALCASCDDMYHRHPKRRHHQRQALSPGQMRDERPPLPPKTAPPVPPPRRHKLSGDRASASPRPPGLDQRRATIGHISTLPAQPHMQAHNNHIQSHTTLSANTHLQNQIPPHLQNKLVPATAQHVGSTPYLASTSPVHHAAVPMTQLQIHSNTLAAWGRQRGSLQGFNMHPNMGNPTEAWESPDSVSPTGQNSWGRPLRRGASVLELGGGGGGAGCAHCGPAPAPAAWRYGSCASLEPAAWPAWQPPCCMPPQHHHPPHMHAHVHAHSPHTPQPYRRGERSRAASRAGSRGASPAPSTRSRASRRAKPRSPSPPLPSSDADSESESDSPRPPPAAAATASVDRLERRDRRTTPNRVAPNRPEAAESQRRGRDRLPKERPPSSPPTETKEEAKPEAVQDESLGPAPSPPDVEWQCEHCTFVNEAGVRVCAVCCRTPTAAPRVLPAAERLARLDIADPEPAAQASRSLEKDQQERNVIAQNSLQGKERASTGCGPSPPRDEKPRKPLGRLVTPTRDASVNNREERVRHDMGVGPSPPRDASPAPPPARRSVSVGPSPPRDRTQRPNQTTEPPLNGHKTSTGTSPTRVPTLENRASVKTTRNVSNTGTSPPPQSISTQTYEATNNWERASSVSRSRPRRRFRDEAQRERSHSRHSLSSDTRESDRSVRTGGGRWEWRSPRDSSPGAGGDWPEPGDWSGSERRPQRRASHLDLRRTRSTRRAAYYGSEAASPERLGSHRAVSLEALAGGAARREAERGLELARLMTEAERLGFSAAEVHAALAQSPAAPLTWLRERWPSLCAGVRAAAERLAPGATIGDNEARAALARHRGAMWPAVTECVQRARRPPAAAAAAAAAASVRGRVWGSPAGAEADAAPPARRSLREESSDEFEAPVPIGYDDDDWMYLPLDPPPQESYGPGPISGEDVWSEPVKNPIELRAEDIAIKLKTLLLQAGVPSIDENLLLKGLLADNNVFKPSPEVVTPKDGTTTVEAHSADMIQSENDFIDAYNALTRASPLPAVKTEQLPNIAVGPDISLQDTHSESNISNTLLADNDNTDSNEVTFVLNIRQPSTSSEVEDHSEIPDTTEDIDLNDDIQEQNRLTEELIQTKTNTQSTENVQKDAPVTLVQEVNAKPKQRTNNDVQNNSQPDLTNLISNGSTDNVNTSRLSTSPSNLHKNSLATNSITEKNTKNKQDAEKANNLNDIVGDTQRLIQQMKEEINSDINSLDGHSMSQSEVDNSSNESDFTSEHESSYSESEDETEDITSDEHEDSTSEEETDDNAQSQKSEIVINRTSSEENDQFEEAMEHIEEQNENFKQTNIEILDSIARSLQEEHTISLEIERNESFMQNLPNSNQLETPEPKNIEPDRKSDINVEEETDIIEIEEMNSKEDFNNNLFKEVNSFEEIYEQLTNTSKKETTSIDLKVKNTKKTKIQQSKTNKMSDNKKQTSKEHNVLIKNEIEEVPIITLQKFDIVNEIFQKDPPSTLIISEIKRETFNAVLDNIEEPVSIEDTTETNTLDVTIESTFKQDASVTKLTSREEVDSNGSISDESSSSSASSRRTISPVKYTATKNIVENKIDVKSKVNASDSSTVTKESIPKSTNLQEINVIQKTETSDERNLPKNLLKGSFEPETTETSNRSQIKLKSSFETKSIEKSNSPEKTLKNTLAETTEKSNSPEKAFIISLGAETREKSKSPVKTLKGTSVAEIAVKKNSPEEIIKSSLDESKNITGNKSHIPKLVKVLTGNKQKVDKNSQKGASKVPVRRGSLKQYPAPAPPKVPFGNILNGHVKQLQTRLFNNKPLKNAPSPASQDAIPSTSTTLSKKRPAPQPPSTQDVQAPPKSPTKESKHYFRETCRTEDEWTESDSEESPLPVGIQTSEEPLRAPSPLPPITMRRVSGQLVDLATVRFLEGSPERQARMLLADGALENWDQAQLAVELVSRGAEPPAALLAALECVDLNSALAYLHQECELCASRLPEHEMVTMLRCTHRCCRECARHYFTVQITERSIADCVCPYCKEPELENLPEDSWLEYFAHLDILLKTLLGEDVHELFQRKLRDRTLARDPNFRWCVECSSGFFVHPKQKKLRCPECKSVSCATCRKPWSSNHEGLSCEQYATWLEDNDPEKSVAAVQQHLRENGLECPRCHFKYSLSRGGCMHFTCTQCKYEFCYGCGKPFMMGARCGLSEYCARLGLHAHHPRNCLFYLRDKEPHELQTLLQMNNVSYETEAAAGGTNRCPIQLQKETPTGLIDAACGSEVPPKHAGLCRPHYVEYLAGLARRLDPIPIMEVSELVAELRRRALPLPERGPWDTDPIYAGMCAEIVKEKIPLD